MLIGSWPLGWPWQFLKIRQRWSLPHWLALFLTSDFFRTQCWLIALYPQYNIFQLWGQCSQTLLLDQLSLLNILNPLFSFQTVFTRSRFPLKKPLSLLIHEKQFLIHSGFIMRLQQFVPSSAPLLVLLLFPPRLQFLPPLKSWTPQSHPWGLESASSKLLWMLIFWPLTMNHECSSWHLQWWILSRGFSIHFT